MFHNLHFPEVLDIPTARSGRPIVPVSELVTLVNKATSGASSKAPWERFAVGKYEDKFSRLPQ